MNPSQQRKTIRNTMHQDLATLDLFGDPPHPRETAAQEQAPALTVRNHQRTAVVLSTDGYHQALVHYTRCRRGGTRYDYWLTHGSFLTPQEAQEVADFMCQVEYGPPFPRRNDEHHK